MNKGWYGMFTTHKVSCVADVSSINAGFHFVESGRANRYDRVL